VVRLFWEVVEEMTAAQRSALLRFVTSSSRAPLGGFQHLNPPFTLHRVDCGPRNPLAGLVGKDIDLLPSARWGSGWGWKGRPLALTGSTAGCEVCMRDNADASLRLEPLKRPLFLASPLTQHLLLPAQAANVQHKAPPQGETAVRNHIGRWL
jgi:hypothetical protein